MANLYYPGILPEEYNQAFLVEEFTRISSALAELEVPLVTLLVTHVVPSRPQEGMVINADGTDWNPGSGAGLYEYVGGAWNKL